MKQKEFNVNREPVKFNLSEKISELAHINNFRGRPSSDDIREIVKELILRRNVLDRLLHDKKITWYEYKERRNKLAGEKLI